jgi:hypothetical protein
MVIRADAISMPNKAVSRSASLPDFVDEEVRSIAARENRSIGNVVENAVRVFTLLPKELRDVLVEIADDRDQAAVRMSELARQLLHAHARERLLLGSAQLGGKPGPDEEEDEFEGATVLSTRL